MDGFFGSEGSEEGLHDSICVTSISLCSSNSFSLFTRKVPYSTTYQHASKQVGVEQVTELSPGFYNCLFLFLKASWDWRPVLNVYCLNKFVPLTAFLKESPSTVLAAIQKNNWIPL